MDRVRHIGLITTGPLDCHHGFSLLADMRQHKRSPEAGKITRARETSFRPDGSATVARSALAPPDRAHARGWKTCVPYEPRSHDRGHGESHLAAAVGLSNPAPHSRPISAANALALKSAPVACRVKPFQSSERPGSKTFVFKNSPTALLPTKLA